MKMDEIIKKVEGSEGIEARLIRTPNHFFIGAYDKDAEEYYPGARIFPYKIENAKEKAFAYFDCFVNDTKISAPVF
jgi:hypothetical protein